MADVPGACERQPVEHRPVPVRVRAAAKPLGAGGHGPVQPTDRRLRHTCRRCGWQRTVPHVQPRDSRAVESDAPQLRQRSAVPVPPMARQPSGPAGDRGQECSLRSDVPSVCRTVDRHTATRMLGSHTVLVRTRPVKRNCLTSRTSITPIGPMRLWKDGRQSRHGRMSQCSTTTDGKRIAAVSIRRRLRRDI